MIGDIYRTNAGTLFEIISEPIDDDHNISVAYRVLNTKYHGYEGRISVEHLKIDEKLSDEKVMQIRLEL